MTPYQNLNEQFIRLCLEFDQSIRNEGVDHEAKARTEVLAEQVREMREQLRILFNNL